MRSSSYLFALGLAVVAGCHLVVGADDFQVNATGGSTGGGAAGQGGSGPDRTLADDGLVVRYYIDEAASGIAPSMLQDAAHEEPLALELWYQGPDPAELEFEEVFGRRALRWLQVANNARASRAIGDTKIYEWLHGSTTGTIEVVADVRGVTDQGARLSHIGWEQEPGRFTLSSKDMGELQLYVWANGACTPIGDWDVNLEQRRRTVLHVVFDSAQGEARDRVRLYADGQRVTGNDGSAVAQDLPLDLGQGCHYVLGNRETGQRSFRGWLHYAALYSTALSDTAVDNNFQALDLDDDTP